jgi:RNA polymerase sigma-70 factor, ECF subfamily
LFQSDSEKKVKQLFDEHFHHLVLFAFRYVNDYGQCEDIVQDVYVKVWQNFEQIKRNSDLKAYLYKAVQNSSFNFLRHIKIRQKFIDSSELEGVSEVKSVEEGFSDEETKNKIHHAVNKLPDKWKEAFVFSKYDNLKYHEIAEEMKISQKTVEKYISKALQFLRNELKDLVISIIFLINIFKL